MATYLFLATEGHGGFGINLDILETNIINLSIVIAILFIFGRKILTNNLNDRRAKIEAAINDAQNRQQKAAASLAEAKKNLEKATAEAEEIRQKATVSAEAARAEILAQSKRDIERMQQNAVADLNSERDKAIAELRQKVAQLAMQQVETQLQSVLDENVQQQLVDRSIALVGGN
jgi:F-type H+-transporting ATPase subunit b